MKDELGLGARLLDGGSSQENENDDDVYVRQTVYTFFSSVLMSSWMCRDLYTAS